MADKLGDAKLFAGIDGGGTKTLAIVVDHEGVERGRGLAGSANYGVVGQERAVAHINSAISQALEQTGNLGLLAAVWIGLAGVDRPADRERLFPLLQPLAPVIELGNDGELALAALPRAHGVAVIAGTGAIVLGRDARNEVVRASGWGHVFGDEGSGHDVGRLALQAAARAADGRGPSTELLPALLKHWDLADATGLIDRVYHDSRPGDIARLSSVVFTVAREGDLTARGIIRHAAAELARAVETVASRLSFPEGDLPLAIGGGLLISQVDLRRSVVRRLRRRLQLGSVEMVAEPALSAARAARRLVVQTPGDNMTA